MKLSLDLSPKKMAKTSPKNESQKKKNEKNIMKNGKKQKRKRNIKRHKIHDFHCCFFFFAESHGTMNIQAMNIHAHAVREMEQHNSNITRVIQIHKIVIPSSMAGSFHLNLAKSQTNLLLESSCASGVGRLSFARIGYSPW